jgi:hypothetical protein
LPGELSAEERARVLSRLSSLRGRSGLTIGFKPMFDDAWFPATNTEELDAAVSNELSTRSKGGPHN